MAETTTDTYHWDTVFALRVADVNNAIAAANSTPPSFQVSTPEGWQVSANFDHWRMTTGGDGNMVKFSIPVKSGSMVNADKTLDLSGISAIVLLELGYFDSTTQHPTSPKDGTFHDLKVNTQPKNPGDKVATVTDIDFGQNPTSLTVEVVFKPALEGWLNQNLAIFDHVFATVNLGKYVDQGKFSWVTPTATDYAFMTKDSEADSMLGVLCMTENRSADGLIPQLSVNAIPDNSPSGYLIANERYLSKLLLPALPHVFNGLEDGDIGLSSDQQSLILLNKGARKISISPACADTGDPKTEALRQQLLTQMGAPNAPPATTGCTDTYTSTLNDLRITIEDTYVEIYSLTSTPLLMGIVSFCETTHRYQIVKQQKSNGKPTLNYITVGDPVINHWNSHTDPTAEVLFSLIAALIISVLAAITGAANTFVGALLVGLLIGVVVSIPQIIALIGTDDAPEMDLLVLNATSPIVWAGQDKFNLQSATLNGCLQMGGTFIPSTS